MTVVVVQSDSLAAWLGLAGVAVGGLLTAGAAWLQQRSSERKDQRRAVNSAASELLAAADALVVTVQAFVVCRTEPGAVRDWVPAITALLERMQKANETIARLCESSLVRAADKLAEAAREFAHGFGGSQDGTALVAETRAFSAAARQLKA